MNRRKKFAGLVAVILLLIICLYSFRQHPFSTMTTRDRSEHGSESPNRTGKPVKDTPPELATSARPDTESRPVSNSAAETRTTPTEVELREALRTAMIIVRGKVYMPDKSLAKNVPVFLQRHEQTAPTGYAGAGQPLKIVITTLDSTTTDSDGRYELGTTDVFALVVQSRAEGTALASLAINPKILPISRRKDGVLLVECDIRLTEAKLLRGRTVDGDDTPLSGVRITATQLFYEWGEAGFNATVTASATSNSEGKFVFDQLTEKNTAVHALLDGYSPAEKETKSFDDELKLVMKTGGAVVAGKVQRIGTNDPVPHAKVQIFARLPKNMVGYNLLELSTECADDGTFRIENIPPGAYMLVAQTQLLRLVSSNLGGTPDFALGENEVRDDFVLYLGPGVTFTGTVRDAVTKEPIDGAKVFPRSISFDSTQNTALSDQDGKYVLQNVFGRIDLQGQLGAGIMATKSGYAMLEPSNGAEPEPVTLSIYQTEATQDVELYRTVQVSGRVLTLQAAPVVGAKVTLTNGNSPDTYNPTDPLGRFTLQMIANTRGQLRIDAADYAITFSEVVDVKDKPIADLVVTINPGATVILHVVDKDEKKIQGASAWGTVRVFGEGGSGSLTMERLLTPANGSVTFAHFATPDFPIPMDVKKIQPAFGATMDGYTPAKEARPDLRSGQTQVVTVVLRDEAKHFAAGIIRDPEGKPLDGVLLQCYNDGISAGSTSSGGGNFRLDGLSEPPYKLNLYHGDVGSDSATIAEADRTDIEIVMGRNTALLTCLVVDSETDQPVADLAVQSLGADNESTVVLDPAAPGRFRMERAVTGLKYVFNVKAKGYTATTTELTIPEGQKEFIQVIQLKKTKNLPQ